MLPLLLAVVIAETAPAPTAPPLKTIITVKSTPLCQTLVNTVLPTLAGLKIDDKIVASTKPQLVNMAKAWQTDTLTGHHFDQMQIHENVEPADIHDNNSPAMNIAAHKLSTLAAGLAHNLIVAETKLANAEQFPNPPKTAEDQEALQLKADLDTVARQQLQNLNTINGLAETFDLKQLIAQGDGTQGALNESFGNKQPIVLSHNDQNIDFQDVTQESSRAGDIATTVHPKDPTADTDPSVSQEALGQYANNPVMRFYAGVVQNEAATAQAEAALTNAVVQAESQCEK